MTGTTAAAKPLQSQTRWIGGHRFESGNGGRTHVIDAGAEVAPGPMETLLSTIATCSGVDVLDILAKRRTPVESLEIDVTAVRRADPPRRLMSMTVEYRVTGAGIEAVHAERAIALAFEKYCSVAASLAPDIEAHSVLVLNGQSHPPVRQAIWTQG
jgi:putative redox protein